MKPHIQIVAALHIALGALSVIGAIVLFACLGLAGTIVIAQGEQAVAGILGIIAVVLCGFLVLLGLPGIIGGWALITERSWGRPLVLVLGVLNLFNLPIGTAFVFGVGAWASTASTSARFRADYGVSISMSGATC
jgi:hypothetical protein